MPQRRASPSPSLHIPSSQQLPEWISDLNKPLTQQRRCEWVLSCTVKCMRAGCMLGCRQQRVDNDGQKHSHGGADLPRFSAHPYTFHVCGTSEKMLLVLVVLIVCLPLRTLVPCLSNGAPSSSTGLEV